MFRELQEIAMITLENARKIIAAAERKANDLGQPMNNRALMMAVLHERIHIAQAVNATVISLDEAPRGYADFDRGVARKFVIEPAGLLRANA
jgi:hypothetical protein